MPTLGDKLRTVETAQAEEKARRLATEAGAAEIAERARREVVREFFANAQRLTAEAIGAGKIPPPFVTPSEVKGNGTYTILDPTHPDHGIYAEFLTWAASEGLTIEGQCHQTGGRSAARLYVQAAKK
jgi:hypothetical protein